VEIPAQSLADFALTYNFQGTHILGASRGHLCDSSVFLLDQELIYRYSSCSSCWGDLITKFGTNVLEWIHNYTSSFSIGFTKWRHNFKMAATTSFHAENAAVWWENI